MRNDLETTNRVVKIEGNSTLPLRTILWPTSLVKDQRNVSWWDCLLKVVLIVGISKLRCRGGDTSVWRHPGVYTSFAVHLGAFKRKYLWTVFCPHLRVSALKTSLPGVILGAG